MIAQIIAAHPELAGPLVGICTTIAGTIFSLMIIAFFTGISDTVYSGTGRSRFARFMQLIPSYSFGVWLSSDGELY